MAPRPPVSREQVLRVLESSPFASPYRFGAPVLQFAICAEPDAWRLRRLVIDAPRFDAHAAHCRATGRNFLPEHGEEFLIPDERVILEAPDKEAFVASLQTIPWPPPFPDDWVDRRVAVPAPEAPPA